MRLWLLAPVLACACSADLSSDSARESRLSRPELVHCSLGNPQGSDFFATLELTCHTAGSAEVIIELTDRNDSIDLTAPNQPQTRLFYSDKLPIQLKAHILFSGAADWQEGSTLEASGSLAKVGDEWVLTSPFELWTLNLTAPGYAAVVWKYDLPLAPFSRHDGSTVAHVHSLTSVQPGQTVVVTLPVAPGQTLAGRLFDQTPVSFTGPGDWIVNSDSIQSGKVAAPMDPPAPSPTPTPSPTPSIDPPATPMDPPAMPAPTCGTDGLIACPGNSCDPNTIYDYNDGLCHACGADGLIACSGNSCDAHTIYDFNDSDCHACGAEGLRPCAGNSCDDGLSYDWSQSVCVKT